MKYNVIDENGDVINLIEWDGITPLDLPYKLELVDETVVDVDTVVVPDSISYFQATTILMLTKVPNSDVSLYDATDSYMNSLDLSVVENRVMLNAWKNTSEFKRLSKTIALAQQMFGLTDEQVDEMFIAASKIEA